MLESTNTHIHSFNASQFTPRADNEDRGAISTLNGDLSAKIWASGTTPGMLVGALRAGLRFFTTQSSNQAESDSEDDDDADRCCCLK